MPTLHILAVRAGQPFPGVRIRVVRNDESQLDVTAAMLGASPVYTDAYGVLDKPINILAFQGFELGYYDVYADAGGYTQQMETPSGSYADQVDIVFFMAYDGSNASGFTTSTVPDYVSVMAEVPYVVTNADLSRDNYPVIAAKVDNSVRECAPDSNGVAEFDLRSLLRLPVTPVFVLDGDSVAIDTNFGRSFSVEASLITPDGETDITGSAKTFRAANLPPAGSDNNLSNRLGKWLTLLPALFRGYYYDVLLWLLPAEDEVFVLDYTYVDRANVADLQDSITLPTSAFEPGSPVRIRFVTPPAGVVRIEARITRNETPVTDLLKIKVYGG